MAKTATQTATSQNGPVTEAVMLTPPAVSRTRESSASPALVKSMADKYREGWVSDGVQYPEKRLASNASVVYRRALIRQLGGDPSNKADEIGKTIKSKVWAPDPDVKAFVFGLTARS